jgi:hypothetical protein
MIITLASIQWIYSLSLVSQEKQLQARYHNKFWYMKKKTTLKTGEYIVMELQHLNTSIVRSFLHFFFE